MARASLWHAARLLAAAVAADGAPPVDLHDVVVAARHLDDAVTEARAAADAVAPAAERARDALRAARGHPEPGRG